MAVDVEMRRERLEFERKSKRVLEILAQKDERIAELEQQVRTSARHLAETEASAEAGAAAAAKAAEAAELAAEQQRAAAEQERATAVQRERELVAQLKERERDIFELNESQISSSSRDRMQQQQQQCHSPAALQSETASQDKASPPRPAAAATARALREQVMEKEEQIEVLLAEVSRLRRGEADARLPQQQQIEQLQATVRQLRAVNATLEAAVRCVHCSTCRCSSDCLRGWLFILFLLSTFSSSL